MTSHEQDFGPTPSAKEREMLALLGDRLERERPVPNAGFRGELRRLLITSPRRSRSPSPQGRYRLWAVSYAGTGALCLAVAAIGLAGAGPFAA